MYQAYLLGGSNDGLWEEVEDGEQSVALNVAGAFAPQYISAEAPEPAREIYSDIGATLDFRVFVLDGGDWTLEAALVEVARRRVAEARQMTEADLISVFDNIADGVELSPLEQATLDEMEMRGIEA